MDVLEYYGIVLNSHYAGNFRKKQIPSVREVSPVVLSSCLTEEFKREMADARIVIHVEESSMGQLNQIPEIEDNKIDRVILWYNGRLFALEELLENTG